MSICKGKGYTRSGILAEVAPEDTDTVTLYEVPSGYTTQVASLRITPLTSSNFTYSVQVASGAYLVKSETFYSSLGAIEILNGFEIGTDNGFIVSVSAANVAQFILSGTESI